MMAQPVKLRQVTEWSSLGIFNYTHIVPQSTVLALVHINAHFEDFGSLLQTFAYMNMYMTTCTCKLLGLQYVPAGDS